MTRPLPPRGRDVAGQSGPALSDTPPGRATTLPAERDPLTGKWLSGDPAGRADKGRQSTSRPPHTVALVAAGALLAAGIVALVLLLTGGDDDGTPAAQPAASSAPATEPTAEPTPEPPAFTGPRTVPIALTTTSITPPPGFGPDPAFGAVGEVRARTWVLTGDCDGIGTCSVEHCVEPGDCRPPLAATPIGGGQYTATSTGPVYWANPSCSGGSISVSLTFTVTGPPEAPSVKGTWVESADPVVLPGPALCGIYLGTFAITSA